MSSSAASIEETELGDNMFWGTYGTDKIMAGKNNEDRYKCLYSSSTLSIRTDEHSLTLNILDGKCTFMKKKESLK